MDSGAGARAWPLAGSPIRAPRDLRPFAPPPGLSRLAAPFVGFLRQGIRRAPISSSLSAWFPSCGVDPKLVTRDVMVFAYRFCIAIADATPRRPPSRGGSRIRIMDLRTARMTFVIRTNVSISMKRYAAVKVRRARDPGGRMPGRGRAGRARSPRSCLDDWSP